MSYDHVTSADVAEVLQRTLTRIEDPRRWTFGASARDAYGRLCYPQEPEATCWCLTGAFLVEVTKAGARSDEDALWYESWSLIRDTIRNRYDISVARFNDEHGHAAVLALLRELIAAFEPTLSAALAADLAA